MSHYATCTVSATGETSARIRLPESGREVWVSRYRKGLFGESFADPVLAERFECQWRFGPSDYARIQNQDRWEYAIVEEE